MNFIFILQIKMAISNYCRVCVTGGNLINLAAVEKTQRKNITVLYWHEIFFLFFSQFSKNKNGPVGSVKQKIKKLWP